MFDRPSPVLTAAAMRRADEYTIDVVGIPGFTLMESAGRGTARALAEHLPARSSAAVYCGKGNNGGDGFVIARCLYERGFSVTVVHLGEAGGMSDDAEAQFEILRKIGARDEDDRLTVVPYDADAALPDADVHVDALLGTGLTSELREPIRTLVNRLNETGGLKIAVDIPTGLHTDRGRPLGSAFRADITYTMGALKAGLCLHEGPAYAGDCEVLDIGIPSFALRERAEGDRGSAYRSSDAVVRSWMPERGTEAHKYSVGLALVVAGSQGMTGAPVMASLGAARGGAGYVICGCDERIQSALGVKLTEVTTIPLPASDDGIDPDGGLDALSARLEKAGALLVGCGLGQARHTQAFVHRLVQTTHVPTVIDADGLNALVGATDLIEKHAGGRWILTPHMGEFRRLAGDDLDRSGIDPDDRVTLARHFAEQWNCVLILKGLPSIVASPEGRAWINATGGTALATAGTGDVLAGICAGLAAQGLTPEQAAVAALHLGGAAADRFSSQKAGRSMMAMDLLSELPFVMKDCICS